MTREPGRLTTFAVLHDQRLEASIELGDADCTVAVEIKGATALLVRMLSMVTEKRPPPLAASSSLSWRPFEAERMIIEAPLAVTSCDTRMASAAASVRVQGERPSTPQTLGSSG
jgi:hypothetical protein